MNFKGWDKSSHQFDLNSLIKRKDEYIAIVLSQVKKEFNVDISSFHQNNIEHIELAKAIIRAFLRYDNSSILLTKTIAIQVQERFPEYNVQYCTLPYPIIHFSNDTSEIGPLHTDGQPNISNFITTWAPLNDCFHHPILIKEKSGISITPDLKVGEYLFWDGATEHEGLLNKSGKIHITLVNKITNSPLINERTSTISELLNFHRHETQLAEPPSTFINIYKKIKEIGPGIKEKPLWYIFSEAQSIIDLWDLCELELKRISFMLTLFSQRLEPYRDMTLFYIFSVICYQDNLLGLQKAIDYSVKNFGTDATELFVSNYLKTNRSFQTVSSINQMKLLKHIPDTELKLLKWN